MKNNIADRKLPSKDKNRNQTILDIVSEYKELFEE